MSSSNGKSLEGETNNLEGETNNNENNNENNIENKTSEELLNTIAENIFEYYDKNKDNLKGMSLEDIFFSYVENNKDIIKEVEVKLGKELSFNDIKYLYIQTNYTLEEGLTKNIFKHFKQKEAVKSVIRVFQNKIQERGFNVDFEQFLGTEIQSNEDIDNLFKNISDYLQETLKDLNKEDKEKIKNTKITNEEIINQLISDGIIKNTDYLEKNINELRQETGEEIQNILNIHSTLLNANIVNSINELLNYVSNIQKALINIERFGTLGDVLEKYNISKIEKDEIDELFKKYIEPYLSSEDKKFIDDIEQSIQNKSGESIEDKKNILYKFKKEKLLKEIKNNPNIYIDFIEKHEKENNEEGLADILRKIINNDTLTEKDQSLIINIFKEKYIDNISRIITKGFNLTQEQEKIYKSILSQLLDPSDNLLSLPNGINIGIKKEVILPNVKTINELFEVEPVIRFEIVGEDVNYFKDIFQNYFTKINDNNYTTVFTKVKIKDKDGNEYTGYIQEGLNDTIEIYEQNPIDSNQNPKKIIKKSKITKIEKQEEKLLLKSGKELKDLCVGMVSYFENKKIDYNAYAFKRSLKSRNNKNTKQNNEDTQKNNENMDYEIDILGFKKEWSKLEGDEKAEFKVGSILEIKGKSLENYPGIKSNWFQAEIIDINENTGYFKIKLKGGGFLNLEGEGNEYEIPMIPRWIINMKSLYGGNIFKFNKIKHIESFGDSLNNINLKSDSQSLKTGLSLWSNNIEIKDNKLVRKNEKGEYEEIEYIGKISGNKSISNDSFDNYSAWKIEIINNNKVVLKYAYDKNFSKTLDLNTFLMFIIHNNFQPWTKRDIGTVEENNPADINKKGFFKLTGFSLQHIRLGVKQIIENRKYYKQEQQELKTAEMFKKLTWFLPNIGFLGDVKMEAGGERESKIWNIIKNAQARLERAGEGKGKNHGKVTAEIIEKEIFSKAKKGEKLSYRTKLKAAGYLMYALEKGPGPYFRALAKYEGKGYWVRALLGNQHYKTWQLKNKLLQEQLKKEPGNEAIRDELIKSEIFYIKDLDETTSYYSASFGSTIEGLLIGNVYSSGKVKDTYEGESIKGNYYLIRNGLKSYILNNRPPNSLGALQALTERVDNDDDYIDYYKIISSFIFTGYLFNNYNTPFKEQFDKICRTYGVPIGLFAKELNGLNKLLKIFDYIVRKKNIKLEQKSSFTEYLYGTKDPNSIDIMSIRSKDERAKIMSKLDKFWTLHGEDIVSSLDYTDQILITSNEDSHIKQEEKKAIDNYFSKVNDDITESFSFNSDLFKTAYAPYYQKGIFNIPAGPFQHIALTLDDGEFDGKNKALAEGVWNGIILKLQGMENIINNNEVYKFILKKYLNWFGRFYKGKYKTEFINALKSGDNNKIHKMIVDFNIDNYGDKGKIPPEMENGLEKFVSCLAQKPNNIDEILNEVF